LVFVSGPLGGGDVTVVAAVCCRGTRERLALQLRSIEALPFLSLPLSLPLAFFLLFSSSVFFFFPEFFLYFFSFSCLLVLFPHSLSVSLSFSGAQEDQISFCRSCGSSSEIKRKKLERRFFPADEFFLMR
jgi:hypothetical protein